LTQVFEVNKLRTNTINSFNLTRALQNINLVVIINWLKKKLEDLIGKLEAYPDCLEDSFLVLYSISQEFSKTYGLSLERVAKIAFKYYEPDKNFSMLEIFSKLKDHFKNEISTQGQKNSSRVHQKEIFQEQVWLLIGESGQGKSSFVNHFCGAEVAKEGDTVDSETSR